MPITDLRALAINMGFALRTVLAALFDDILLGVPSVLALTVTMPELFRQGRRLDSGWQYVRSWSIWSSV